MTDTLVSKNVAERDDKLRLIETLTNNAAESGTDLSEDSLTAIASAKERIAAIDRQLEIIGDNLAMTDEARERLARVSPGSVAPPTEFRSSGEMLYSLLHQADSSERQRMTGAMNRAAQHMGNLIADTTATAGDLDGIAVTPIVGPTVNPDWRSMPFVNSLGPRNVPAYTFERPYITDAGVDTGVGAQSAQKAELASVAFQIESDILKSTTLGGYLNVSQQLISLQPGSLQVIYDQMRVRMSRQIENFHVTSLETSTGLTTLALDADAATVLAAIYDASAAVFDGTGDLATTIVMGPGGWARLGSMVDLAGRPLLPSLGPVNASGVMQADTFQATGPAGLQTVVTPAIGISDTTFWVLNNACLESYLYNYPLLESIEPSVLGRQIAVATGAVAHTPTPLLNIAQHLAAA